MLKGKKILVLGLGREGESSFRFLRKHFLNQTIGLADKLTLKKLPLSMQKLIKKDKKVKLHLGKNYLKSTNSYDVIIRSPGIKKDWLLPCLTNQRITSQTEIFLQKYRKQTIGVTGTKGKGTTAGMIYKILKDAGIKAKLIGNMGRPALNYFLWQRPRRDEWFVFEMSSHQLENLRISPHIAVFLNVYPDHLDYFKNFQEYLEAKANISKWQRSTDFFIFNKDFPELKTLAEKSKAKTISFGKKNNYFLSNALAAAETALLFKISPAKIKKSIKDFKNVEHHLEFVGKFKGINFYNDSASTIPQATLAALNVFKDIEALILGGSEKGSEFTQLAKTVLKKKIKTVILFPKEGERIWQEISKQRKNDLPQHFFVNNMKEAAKLCFQQTPQGGICLLSPACASFTTFKNYQDRGKQFKKHIKELARSRQGRK